MCGPLFCIAVLLGLAADRPREPEPSVELPLRVGVLPIFFVPKGEVPPSADQSKRLGKHLSLCQTAYKAMLARQDTFLIAEEVPRVYRSSLTLTELKVLPEDAAPQVLSELLGHLNYNRYTCPYVFLCVVMNSTNDWPVGGGRPINGGFNTGGGIVVLSSRGLDRSPNLQSTLQHEVGHAFGLPHVDVYNYSMTSSPSIMSYNPAHHTSDFKPSATPGRLIPEDLRGLALNRRVFSRLSFDPGRDVPAGAGSCEARLARLDDDTWSASLCSYAADSLRRGLWHLGPKHCGTASRAEYRSPADEPSRPDV